MHYPTSISTSLLLFLTPQLVWEPVSGSHAPLEQLLADGCHDPLHVPSLHDHLRRPPARESHLLHLHHSPALTRHAHVCVLSHTALSCTFTDWFVSVWEHSEQRTSYFSFSLSGRWSSNSLTWTWSSGWWCWSSPSLSSSWMSFSSLWLVLIWRVRCYTRLLLNYLFRK